MNYRTETFVATGIAYVFNNNDSSFQYSDIVDVTVNVPAGAKIIRAQYSAFLTSTSTTTARIMSTSAFSLTPDGGSTTNYEVGATINTHISWFGAFNYDATAVVTANGLYHCRFFCKNSTTVNYDGDGYCFVTFSITVTYEEP